MADVSFERTKSLSRGEAAVWLLALSKGFTHGGDVTLPVGGGGAVTLRLPDDVKAEFEVEVSEGKVQVELEFTWVLGGGRPMAGNPPAAD